MVENRLSIDQNTKPIPYLLIIIEPLRSKLSASKFYRFSDYTYQLSVTVGQVIIALRTLVKNRETTRNHPAPKSANAVTFNFYRIRDFVRFQRLEALT